MYALSLIFSLTATGVATTKGGNDSWSGMDYLVGPDVKMQDVPLTAALCKPCEVFFAKDTQNTTASIKIDQCPCMPDKTGRCKPYDSRYAASTLEEAILNFRDMTKDDSDNNLSTVEPSTTVSLYLQDVQTVQTAAPVAQDDVGPPRSYHNGRQCQSDECRVCGMRLVERLDTAGLLQNANRTKILNDLGLVNALPTRSSSAIQCRRYSFAQASGDVLGRAPWGVIKQEVTPTDWRLAMYQAAVGMPPPPQTLFPSMSPESFDELRDRCSTFVEFSNTYEAIVKEQTDSSTKRRREVKDEANLEQFIIPQPAIGKRFKIACVKRGEPLNAGSKFVSLCDLCWVWREMPAGYFPQYLNELTCVADTNCLSGYGKCNAESRSVDVLPDKNNNQKVETIDVAHSCSCQIAVGSALQNFARL